MRLLSGCELEKINPACFDPIGVRPGRGKLLLESFIRNEFATFKVDEEHPPRLEPPLDPHILRFDRRENTDLARHDDAIVVGEVIATRPQPVAIQDRPMYLPSVNAIEAGPSQGSIKQEWYS